MEDLGILTGLIDDIGSLIAAVTAIMLSFKGRQKWEPCEEDIPKGPVKVVGTLTAVGVALLYSFSLSKYTQDLYFSLAINFSIMLSVGFLTYVLLINQFTYNRVNQKIIGGFWLTDDARNVLSDKENGADNLQRLLNGSEYIDQVWPRFSRGLSKISFLLAYFSVIIGGCLALASASIILNNLK